jgi:hypothetical protein
VVLTERVVVRVEMGDGIPADRAQTIQNSGELGARVGRRESASPKSLAGPSEFTVPGTRSLGSAGARPAAIAAARRALRIWSTPGKAIGPDTGARSS